MAAATAHKGPGVTILVKPGVYRESVTVPASGASGNPFVFQALGPGVILDGADAFDSPAQWTPVSGTVWRASSVTWAPDRVFVDGAPIDSSSDTPPAIEPYTFRYVAGEGLYVNLDGDNPGTHATFVGRRNHGFNLAARSWVTIDGFEIRRTEDRGIRLQTGCTNVVVARNRVTQANSYGIQTVGGINIVIEENIVSDCTFHGIGLTAGATGCIVRGNESFGNAKPGVRVANGIYMFGAPANTLYRNRTHGNQDTGMQIQSGSNDCLVYDNVSWNNGDHGFDHLGATGTRHFNDVACGNFKDGFSIEGQATGTQLTNCIAINNGVNTNEFNLWVDAGSVSGFVSDYNVFWNSTAQPPIKYMSTSYATLGGYQSASGQDAHSIQSDPQFVNAATGDFHLTSGSPAIDSGTSGQPGWPPLDAEGHARFDVPAVPNTGAGPVPFTDRGAHELVPGAVPVASLTLDPTGGTAPLSVTADATGSSDPNGSIVSYQFDFGDGTIVGPQPQPTATHSLAAGSWTVTVTVTDDEGLTASASQPITVSVAQGPPPVAALTLQPLTGAAPLAVTADASGSTDDGTIVSYRFDFGDGTIVGPQAEPTATHTLGAGTWTISVTVTDNDGLTGSANQSITVTTPLGPVAALTLQPTTGIAPLSVTADASGSSDPNGTVVSYRFDFGDGTIVGPQPEPTATHVMAAGSWTVSVTVTDNDGLTATANQPITIDEPPPFVATLTLTPATGNTPLGVTAVASASGGIIGNTVTAYSFNMGNGALFGPQESPSATAIYTPGTYTVSVTAYNDAGQTATTTRQVIVAETGPGPNLVGNSSFESDAAGWIPVGSTITKVAGGFDGSFKLRVQASGSGSFGITDGSNWVDTTAAAGTHYRFRAWVRSDAGQGSVRIRVREYNSSGKQVGPPRQSTPVTLSPVWKLVTIDYVCEAADNNIDFRILDTPLVAGEVMEIDNVMVNIVLGTSTLAVGDLPGAAESGPQMFPNPMRDRAAIRFTLARSGPLRVEVFDVAGRRVRTLVDRPYAPAAPYELPFDGRGADGRRLGPGLYLYRVQAPHGTVSGRFVMVR